MGVVHVPGAVQERLEPMRIYITGLNYKMECYEVNGIST